MTTRHLTANIFSCIPIFLDNDFCKTINLFIIDIYACSVYLEEKAPVENKQTSINKNNHVNVQCFLTFCSGWTLHRLTVLIARPLVPRAPHAQKLSGDRCPGTAKEHECCVPLGPPRDAGVEFTTVASTAPSFPPPLHISLGGILPSLL